MRTLRVLWIDLSSQKSEAAGSVIQKITEL